MLGTQAQSASGEAQRCFEALARVLDADDSLNRRLRRIDGLVCLRDADGGSTTLAASRGALELTDAGSPTVDVTFCRGALDAFLRGELGLTRAVIDGLASIRGPARRLLAASPILSGLLRTYGASSAQTALAEPPRPEQSTLPSDVWAVDVQAVHKRFGPHEVLKGVNLRLPEGAITVVLGPSGTGKSVMLKHLIGLLTPDQGEVVVQGRRLSRLSAVELLDLRRRYGVLFQDGALFGSMNVFDNVAFPLRQHTDLTEEQIGRVVNARLDDVGLLDAADRAPGQLSGGMRKRVGFARALVLDPEIVLFDEPDSGLDPVRTSLLSDLVLDMHPRHGGTYVVITHNIAVAHKLGQYIALLYKGSIAAAGTREEIFASTDPFVCQFLAGEADGPLGMD